MEASEAWGDAPAVRRRHLPHRLVENAGRSPVAGLRGGDSRPRRDRNRAGAAPRQLRLRTPLLLPPQPAAGLGRGAAPDRLRRTRRVARPIRCGGPAPAPFRRDGRNRRRGVPAPTAARLAVDQRRSQQPARRGSRGRRLPDGPSGGRRHRRLRLGAGPARQSAHRPGLRPKGQRGAHASLGPGRAGNRRGRAPGGVRQPAGRDRRPPAPAPGRPDRGGRRQSRPRRSRPPRAGGRGRPWPPRSGWR